MMKYSLNLLFLFLITFVAKAQDNKRMVLETKNAALVLNVGSKGRIYQTHFGERLSAYNELQPGAKEAYVAAGTNNVFEPAIRVVHNDGNASLELKYVNHTTEKKGNITTLRVNCRDNAYPVNVTLVITAYKEEDVFKSAVEISHSEKQPLMISDMHLPCYA